MSEGTHTVFGVRHHGPGSARSLREALEALRPDCILVEGPPDAEEALVFAAREEMKPPVALLIYDPEKPRRSAFYPFAIFSPEWQAVRFGLANGTPVRFMDLPQSIQMGLAEEAEAEAIGVLNQGLSLAAHFSDGTLRAADVAYGLVGAVVKDPVQDLVVWQEYLETVVKERDGWKDLYRASKKAE